MSEAQAAAVSMLRPAKRAPLPQAPRIFDKVDVVPSSMVLKDRLAELRAHALSEEAAEDVGRAARGKRHDQAHRLGGVGLRA